MERGKVWDEIADTLNNIKDPKFKVSKQSIREHFQLLLSKFITKMKTEQWASGIEVKETEVDKAMEVFRRGTAKRKAESDKASAEEVRLRVTEKLSEIKKRKNDEEDCSVKPKKTRRSGGETVEFLRSITSFAKNSSE